MNEKPPRPAYEQKATILRERAFFATFIGLLFALATNGALFLLDQGISILRGAKDWREALVALVLLLVLVVCVAPALATVQTIPSGQVPTVTGTAPFASQPPIDPAKLTCMPLSGPFMGAHFSWDFRYDAPSSAPTGFPGGSFSGITSIYTILQGPWNWDAAWTPNIVGHHVAYCEYGVLITFDQPQCAVGAVVEADRYGTWPVTIMALDEWGTVVGTYTRNAPVYIGRGGAFLGLMSTTNNIKSIEMFVPNGDIPGLAFSDLEWRTTPIASWKFWIPPASIPTLY